jgi:hypothetical protein
MGRLDSRLENIATLAKNIADARARAAFAVHQQVDTNRESLISDALPVTTRRTRKSFLIQLLILAVFCTSNFAVHAQPTSGVPRLRGIVSLPDKKWAVVENPLCRPLLTWQCVFSEESSLWGSGVGQEPTEADTRPIELSAGEVTLRLDHTNQLRLRLMAVQYASLQGLQFDWMSPVPTGVGRLEIMTQSNLTQSEFGYALKTLLAWQGVKVISCGEKQAKAISMEPE